MFEVLINALLWHALLWHALTKTCRIIITVKITIFLSPPLSPGLVGVLFHKKQEPAFSVSRMGLATGMLLGIKRRLPSL